MDPHSLKFGKRGKILIKGKHQNVLSNVEIRYETLIYFCKFDQPSLENNMTENEDINIQS